MTQKQRQKVYLIIGIHLFLLLSYFTYKNFDTIMWYLNLREEPEAQLLYEKKTPAFTVTYRHHPNSLEPTLTHTQVKSVLHNIYEGLVGFDNNLNIKPKMAISWGKIDDLTWEFQLRPNVRFHNGESFTADDVIETYRRFLARGSDLLRTRLHSISEISKIDDLKIHIVTKYPDPLLLQKLTDFYILSEKTIHQEANYEGLLSQTAVGSGPYKFVDWNLKDRYVQLEMFEDYYHGLPQHETVFLKSLPNKHARAAAVRKRETDILVDVPPVFVNQIINKFRFKTYVLPKMESSFLLFNFREPAFQSKSVRKAIGHAIDYKGIQKIIGQFGVRLAQLIPAGVFGFNPDLPLIEYDMRAARALVAQADIEGDIEIDFVCDVANERLAYYIKTELERLGLEIELELVDPSELLVKLREGEGDMFLFGWQFYDADVFNMFRSLLHSSGDTPGTVSETSRYGSFNGIAYSNIYVDQLIESAEAELDKEKRLKIIQEIMKIVLYQDIVGVPLFQTYQIYAVEPDLHFIPRVDTLVDLF